MADEPIAAAAAPVIPAAPAPSPAAPAAPIAAPAPTSLPAESAAVAAPSIAAAPAVAAVEPAKPAASLLSEPAPIPPVPADAAPVPAEAPPVEAPAPVYAPFTLPEGVTLGEPETAAFTSLLGKLELAKGDHAQTQAIGQELVSMHLAETQKLVERLRTDQHETFNRTRETWRSESRDKILGREPQKTLASCAAVIEQFGGNQAQIQELRQALDYTGAGDHPAVVRLLTNLGAALGEGRPVVAASAPQVPRSKAQRLYGATSLNGAA